MILVREIFTILEPKKLTKMVVHWKFQKSSIVLFEKDVMKDAKIGWEQHLQWERGSFSFYEIMSIYCIVSLSSEKFFYEILSYKNYVHTPQKASRDDR